MLYFVYRKKKPLARIETLNLDHLKCLKGTLVTKGVHVLTEVFLVYVRGRMTV